MNKLVLVIFSLLYVASAQSYYVSTTGSDSSGDGTKNNPWKTITFALSHLDTLTNEIKTINIKGGIYSDITNGESFPINLTSNFILSGEDASSTVLDATTDSLEAFTRRVINCINLENVRIEKLTITKGLAFMDSIGNYAIGGGIYLKNSNKIIISKNIIKENESIDITGYGANGGGIAVEECSNVIIVDNEILNNYTFADGCNGGGIFINNANVLIRNNLIKNNNTFGQFGSAGGGISVGYSNLPTYIVDNIIKLNKAAVLGGGVYI
ncbi:MAG: right-handed parallel beta-helix repeat-containing protein, partial [Ignavibacteriaceae bacterium]